MEGVLSGRLHHAWLLAGPQGVGKRTFADAASLRLLAGGRGGFEVMPDHPTARLIDAGSHMDHRVLARQEDDKGKLRAQISVDQVRDLQPVLRGTPALGEWRTVIIDSVDDLNRNAANALLKNLEEPPRGTLFFLVSHAPARLLPTIRSRCRLLRFQILSDAEVAAVLQQQKGLDEADIDDLVAVAHGAPGRALEFAGLDVEGISRAIERMIGVPSPAGAAAFAKGFAGANAASRFEAMCRLVPARIAEAVRELPNSTNMRLYEEAELLASSAAGLQLDRPETAFTLGRLLGQVQTKDKQAA